MGLCSFIRRWRKRRQARKAAATSTNLPVRQVFPESDTPPVFHRPRHVLPADYHPELRSGQDSFERSLSPTTTLPFGHVLPDTPGYKSSKPTPSPVIERIRPVERRREPEPDTTTTNFCAVQGLSPFSGGIFGGDPAPVDGYVPQESTFADFSTGLPDVVPDVSDSFGSDLDFGS